MNEMISIIVPVYNAEEFIVRCIESLIGQSYKNIEIIIIDDGSTDDSPQILEKYKQKDSRIIVIRQENKGVSFARNKGINISSGKYICFVDVDDWISLNFIEIMYNKMKNEDVNIIRANFKINEEEKSFKSNEIVNYENLNKLNNIRFFNETILKLINGEIFGYVWLLMIKKDILIQQKIYFEEGLPMMEDMLFYIDLLSHKNRIYFYNKEIYNYYSNNESASRDIKYAKRNFLYSQKVQMILKQRLQEENLYDEKMEQANGIRFLNSISKLFFDVYRKEPEELKNIYEQFIKDENILKRLRNVKLDSIGFKRKIIIIALLKQNFTMLKISLKLRNYASIIKNRIKRKN